MVPKDGINLYMNLMGARMKFVLYLRIGFKKHNESKNEYSPTLLIFVTKTQNSDNFKVIYSKKLDLTNGIQSCAWLQTFENLCSAIIEALCTKDAAFYLHLYVRQYDPDN
jgi:hypothetical protein